MVVVLDTNVLSEVFKPDPNPTVVDWLAAQLNREVYITAITASEMLYGLHRMPAGKRRAALLNALGLILEQDFRGRVLPFDEAAARRYGALMAERDLAGRTIDGFDAQIASIAHVRGMAVATRNTSHFEGCGIPVVNPWAGSAAQPVPAGSA